MSNDRTNASTRQLSPRELAADALRGLESARWGTEEAWRQAVTAAIGALIARRLPADGATQVAIQTEAERIVAAGPILLLRELEASARPAN